MKPYLECPQFDGCSCNACPLDPFMDQRPALSGEEECGARRATRLAIAARSPGLLPLGGLLPAEVASDRRRAAARERWAALPEAEKAKRLEVVAAGRRVLLAKRAGTAKGPGSGAESSQGKKVEGGPAANSALAPSEPPNHGKAA